MTFPIRRGQNHDENFAFPIARASGGKNDVPDQTWSKVEFDQDKK